jgi:hypothetical protein
MTNRRDAAGAELTPLALADRLRHRAVIAALALPGPPPPPPPGPSSAADGGLADGGEGRAKLAAEAGGHGRVSA